jgi:hypothetical protein
LEETGKCAGSEDDWALLVAGADAVEEKLRERGDVFAALAQRGDGEANGSEAKGEVGEKKSLAGHLAEGGGIGVGGQPLAGVAALKGAGGEG